MVARLRSISKRIRWSLLLRAGVFALTWWLAPFWLFFLLALYLYLVPLFQAGKLAVPFLLLLLLAYLQAPSPVFFFIFGGLFYAIMTVKDLLVIDRQSAYELLALVLSFLLLRAFFLRFDEGVSGPSGAALAYSLLTAIVLMLLLRSFIECFREDIVVSPGVRRAGLWLSLLLFWQILIAGLFLPLDFVYQTVAVFLVAILIFDLVPDYFLGNYSANKALAAGSIIFALYVIVFASARWGL